jgi:hypothetical protein
MRLAGLLVGEGFGRAHGLSSDVARGHHSRFEPARKPEATLWIRVQLIANCNGKRVFAKLRYIWTSGPPIADTAASDSVPIGCKLAAL